MADDNLDPETLKSIDKVIEEHGQTSTLAQRIKNWLSRMSNGELSDDDHNKIFEVIM